jgi:hypothetical protein
MTNETPARGAISAGRGGFCVATRPNFISLLSFHYFISLREEMKLYRLQV